jgi:hypothetical protein
MTSSVLPLGSEEHGSDPKTAAEIFGELLREADLGRQSSEGGNRRRATLLRLKEACDVIAARGQTITGAAVEKHCREAHGMGPRAQSIANEKSKPLGMWHYLQARQAEQAGPARSKRGRAEPVMAVIDGVEDPDQRSRLRDLYAESQLNGRKLRRAQALFAKIAPGVDFDRWLESWKSGATAPATLPARIASTVDIRHIQTLADAIAVLTDARTLDRCGLLYDGKRVKRKGGTGEPLLGLGVIDGLIGLRDALTKDAVPRDSETEAVDGAQA